MAGTGVVYVVELQMSRACEADFLRQVHAMQRRSSTDGSGGQKDDWISVERDGKQLLVTYTS
jgi:hypothetical protein